MKKLFVVVIVMLFAYGLKAQRVDEPSITIGPKVGLNVTNISNIDESKNKVGLELGVFAEFRMSDYFAIQPEFIYSRQGFRSKDDGITGKFRVNYLNIPMLAKVYVMDELSIDLGPQLGFALNGKTKYKGDGHTETDKFTHLNTVELSFAIGLSYHWEDFIFSARYNIGLSNVVDKDYSPWGNGETIGNNKNHVFQLSVGYRFGGLF